MRTEIQTYNLIEQFLKNELSPDELISFKEELANNPELAQDVASQQMIQDIAINSHLSTIKDKTNQYNPYFNPSIRASKYKNFALAFVTLIGTAGIIFMIAKNNFSNSSSLINQKEQLTNTIVSIDAQKIEKVNSVVSNNEETNAQKIAIKTQNPISNQHKKKEDLNITVDTPINTVVDNQKSNDKKESEGEYLNLNRKSQKIIKEEEVITTTEKEYTNNYSKETTSDEKSILVVNSKITIRSIEDTIQKNDSFMKELKNIELETPCHTEHFKLKISVIPNCLNLKTGKISIGKIKGGRAPYFTKLDNITEFSDKHIFEELEGGLHTLYIQDADGCVYEHKIILQTEKCKTTTEIKK